jgi:epoxyqueuosine reductase
VKLFSWTEEEFLENTAGSAIRRIGYKCWLRNIAIALGNATTDPEIILALSLRKTDSSAMVREHVEWALLQHLSELRK